MGEEGVSGLAPAGAELSEPCHVDTKQMMLITACDLLPVYDRLLRCRRVGGLGDLDNHDDVAGRGEGTVSRCKGLELAVAG